MLKLQAGRQRSLGDFELFGGRILRRKAVLQLVARLRERARERPVGIAGRRTAKRPGAGGGPRPGALWPGGRGRRSWTARGPPRRPGSSRGTGGRRTGAGPWEARAGPAAAAASPRRDALAHAGTAAR